MSADFNQFVSDFEQYLTRKESWKGNLTTMTGQTLIELVAALGAFNQTQIGRAFADCFAETAVSDSAIRACALMQGVRMTRKTPAQMTVTLTAPYGVIIPAYSQFECGGQSFFNRKVIEFNTSNEETVTLTATLYQGELVTHNISGNGTNLQTWLSDEDDFAVSDTDVMVLLDSQLIPITTAGLWNYKNQNAVMDLTTSTGRLLLQFGTYNVSQATFEYGEPDLKEVRYGYIPQVNDNLTIAYIVTDGNTGNNYVTIDKKVTIDGFDTVEGTATENPKYGASEKSTLTYKNNTASSFGTYGSAVTKSQYSSVVNTYPGVVDAITQAQREIDPSDLQYMNIIWVTGLTESPWTEEKKQEFCTWCQNISMYSTRFVWVDATPVDRNIVMKVYCYNSAVLTDTQTNVENAVSKLFAPRPGILMTNIYRSDIIDTCLASDPNIAYIVMETPDFDFVVTEPVSPTLTYVINENAGGTLGEQQYSYAVTSVYADGTESQRNNWVHPLVYKNMAGVTIALNWHKDILAVKYKIYGRDSTTMGLITEVDADTLTYTDTGAVTPDKDAFKIIRTVIRYNRLTDLTVTCEYAERQKRLTNSLS